MAKWPDREVNTNSKSRVISEIQINGESGVEWSRILPDEDRSMDSITIKLHSFDTIITFNHHKTKS